MNVVPPRASPVPIDKAPVPDRRRSPWIAWLTLASVLTSTPVACAGVVTLDFARTNGLIRPLHGVNLGPLCYRGMVDLSHYHRELRLPLTRLHDVVWVNYDAVDISSVFRDFRNDPASPDSYDFAATDDYLEAIVQTGSPILYRLGESIEHTPRKYRVHPPEDAAKWAEICCAVIRHYTEGWAGGRHYGIRYWEIWNEPENQPAMWTGSDEQYFRLYEVTAKAIKLRWPNLKVGGPSLGYTGTYEGDEFRAGDFFLRFLRHCRDRGVPLDFFSWHRYAGDPAEFARRAHAVRRILDAHGFTRTESHLNEWNYLPNEDWRPMMKEGQGALRERWSIEMGGPAAAAFAAWSLISFQNAPLDMANFYTAEVQAFGMFTFHGVPRKNFYAFRAFRGLLETPLRVQTPVSRGGEIAVCAGRNPEGDRAAVLLSNYHTPGNGVELDLKQLPWPGPTRFEVSLVDAQNDFRSVRDGVMEPNGRLPLRELTAPSVALVTLAPHRTAFP